MFTVRFIVRVAEHLPRRLSVSLLLVGVVMLSFGLLLAGPAGSALAQGDPAKGNPRSANEPTMHPVFPLLDTDGANVLESGAPVSTMKTCGACHDTAFIAAAGVHNDGAIIAYGAAGSAVLSPTGSVADVGYAPGNVEMNCFLCHTATPDNAARLTALKAGQFAWANTATLAGTGLVTAAGDGTYTWNRDAFDVAGNLKPEFVTMRDPQSANCAQCHGAVHTDTEVPLLLTGLEAAMPDPALYNTLTSGQIVSPQQIARSGLNLADKATLTRPWDVHAERVIACVDCHYALNNPVYYRELGGDKPEHLTFDPRRIDVSEYLNRPLHQFAHGGEVGGTNASGAVTTGFGSTMRRCESCHSTATTHDWLPYKERHMGALACESCHIPQQYAPALQSVDWTVIRVDGTPMLTYRGVEGGTSTSVSKDTLITGFQPALLPRRFVNSTAGQPDERTALAPFNLVTVWRWVADDPPQPVALDRLKQAYLQGDDYHPDVLKAFDANGDGTLAAPELVLDTAAKRDLIAARLVALGVDNARVTGETSAFALNHGVGRGDWAIRECGTCHSEQSRTTAGLPLTGLLIGGLNGTPGGAQPTFIGGDGAQTDGVMLVERDSVLWARADLGAPEVNLYVFGHSALYWLDLLGMGIFFATGIAVLGHSTLRYVAARRRAAAHPELRKVYMYSVYERFWHWLQTGVILGLLFTGIVIHRPDRFSLFPFSFVVQVHNILALILVINAALAAFYHLASGEIRQFLPEPKGFFNDTFRQAKYYLRGIFKGETHPFAKTRDHKMNPLQQITYLMILNVLLPLQVITGALMWAAQHIPDFAASLGGLPLLAPFHTLLAWLFGTFIVAHVYLTTTGHKPLANIKAMMLGWDEVETSETGAATPQAGD